MRRRPQRTPTETRAEQVPLLSGTNLKYRALRGALFFLVFLGFLSHRFTSLPLSYDENAVSNFRIPRTGFQSRGNDAKHSGVPLACMPTLPRGKQYAANAVKSWYLVYAGNPPPLVVYEMDVMDDMYPNSDWMGEIGHINHPWLSIVHLNNETLLVLQDCAMRAARTSNSNIIMLVQDDVLFRSDQVPAHLWARNNIDKANEFGFKLCLQSLFTRTYYLVAQYWDMDDIRAFTKYYTRREADRAEFASHFSFDEIAAFWCSKTGGRKHSMNTNSTRQRASYKDEPGRNGLFYYLNHGTLW